MPYVVGLVLSAVVAVFARFVGFDRDRAFYPTVMIVIALYYVLFAVMSGSVQTVVIESVVMTLFARAAGFDTARRLSIDRLRLASGDHVLIVGAGTGLDLDFLSSNVRVTAIDVTPAMLKHLERRAAGSGRSVIASIMDARPLAFPDSSFDAVLICPGSDHP